MRELCGSNNGDDILTCFVQMRPAQMLQLLQSSSHWAATIAPRSGTATGVGALVRAISVNDVVHNPHVGQQRTLSAVSTAAVDDQVGSKSG